MPVLTSALSFLHDSDHCDDARVAHALPGQAQHQGVKLHTFELAITSVPGGPDELALVQSPGCQPDADSVMHQHFDSVASLIGKEVCRMRVGTAKDGYDSG